MTTASSRRRPARTGGPRPQRGAPVTAPARAIPASTAHAAQLPVGPVPPGLRTPGRRAAERRRAAVMWIVAVAVLGGLVTVAVLATGSRSGTAQNSAVRPAPGFTLTDTSGKAVSVASYRGHDVVLYFNEGRV